ncbi:MAG: orotidine-5'-phosphate decarboxylase [Prevotellaceae bacterium]|jgi:orotidine-5'-phosphate decarboxylase|nr:orotidine-5'-phosphate decarboxylase [Prevotellaceae bacterium]
MKDLIIALDFPNGKKTMEFLDKFTNEKPFVKIGMELFYAEGTPFLKKIKEYGHKIFLDLKLHDIPNTVKSAMRVLADLEIDMVNVHSAGGVMMMKAALEGLTSSQSTRPLLIAVTQLTSTSQEMLRNELLIQQPINDTIVHYAKNVKEAGLDGVVCSPLETRIIKQACGGDFLIITPGIRLKSSAKDDQVRITTPTQAGKNGSDFIVIGRPITQAENPAETYRKCLQEFLFSSKIQE